MKDCFFSGSGGMTTQGYLSPKWLCSVTKSVYRRVANDSFCIPFVSAHVSLSILHAQGKQLFDLS